MLVAPSEKTTTPVGLPGLLPETVAVKVTFWPHTEGLAEAGTTGGVLPWAAVWGGGPVLAPKLASPLYEAVIVCVPCARVDVVKLAVDVPAVVLTLPWPMLVAPSEKTTTPVGLPGPFSVTVAVNVTLWDDADGL